MADLLSTNGQSVSGKYGDEAKEIQDTSRRPDEAVKRLVDDIARLAISSSSNNNNNANQSNIFHHGVAATSFSNSNDPLHQNREHEEIVLASTVSAAIERGIDKKLHSELLSATHKSASQISNICHEHSDAFLTSVSKVVALGAPCSSLRESILENNKHLQDSTGGEMLVASRNLEECRMANARAQTMYAIVLACKRVAVLLERARRQASLCRPRAALDAVDEARHCLTAPLSSLLLNSVSGGAGGGGSLFNTILKNDKSSSSSIGSGTLTEDGKASLVSNPNSGNHGMSSHDEEFSNSLLSLEETPFGKRAMEMLPKIENEVLMGGKRGLNRWFLAMRSGGGGSKAGAAALRKCASSTAIGGPGLLGLGGDLLGYEWRAKNADNLIARVGKQGRVTRGSRMGYMFDRDCRREIDRLSASSIGMQRKAEAFASAFGYYRCWDENVDIGVEISTDDDWVQGNVGKGRPNNASLGFRSRTTVKSRGMQTQWATVLTPSILFEDAPSRKEDADKLSSLAESVAPVRLAETAFTLLGRHDEFRTYYEQNRYGDMKIGASTDAKGSEFRSSLSSLTGDDVSLGTDRVFFAKSLPHLCASVVGFSAVEAALEIGTFEDDDNISRVGVPNTSSGAGKANTNTTKSTSKGSSVYNFLESSAKHERSLIAELGKILRSRAIGATLAELTRASCLMSAFRSALKIVHPSSNTRKNDKELLVMDVDIIMTALKVAQDEQFKAAKKIVSEDIRLDPMRQQGSKRFIRNKTKEPITDIRQVTPEEFINFPFGLDALVRGAGSSSGEAARGGHSSGSTYFIFSHCVPNLLRSIHGRAIAFAAFALSQQELGQVFAAKKGGGIAAYVLDCVEECVSVTAVSMKKVVDNLNDMTVEQAVQITANLTSLQVALPRLFGCLMRGLCHVGMIHSQHLEECFQYAESTLAGANKTLDTEVAAMYTVLETVCKKKIDEHINISLVNFQWIAKSERTLPNVYIESLINYMRQTFEAVSLLDDGYKNGLHFSCCSQIADRLLGLLTDKPEAKDESNKDRLSPISKIDAFGIKNLSLDLKQLDAFAQTTGVPQLGQCFDELKCMVDICLDPDLPDLAQPQRAPTRRKKYPALKTPMLCSLLEKYVGIGMGMKMMGNRNTNNDFLILENKEINAIIRLLKTQR